MASKLGVNLCVFFIALVSTDAQYNGKLIGSFPDIANNHHDIHGDVYAVSSNVIRIIGFSYDGTAPDAVVWGGETGSAPSGSGFPISRYKNCMMYISPMAYRDSMNWRGTEKDVAVSLPVKLRTVQIAIKCGSQQIASQKQVSIHFGDEQHIKTEHGAAKPVQTEDTVPSRGKLVTLLLFHNTKIPRR
eukprot:XP_011674494.1 PREDICTED: uncharacterized protein LOC105443240 [Strongylocentrotus purpuratus]